jgi:HlyD family secretion protein
LKEDTMNTSKFLKTLSFVLLASALLLTGCANSTASANATSTGKVSAMTAVDTIETSGNLSADQLSSLTWNTSGTVDKVNIQTGQMVKAGEVLATLKMNSVPADIITAQADLASAQRDLEDLLKTETTLATAQLAVANAQSAVDEAQKTYASLYFPRASDALISNTEAQITEAKRTVATTADRYRLVQWKPDGDPIKTAAKLSWTNAQLDLNTLLAKYAWYTGKPSATDVAVAKATLESAKATLVDAQHTYEKLLNGPDPVDVAAAQAKVAAAQATVNKMEIIAPFDGVVLTVQTAAGNPVNSGDAAIEMVNRSTLKIEAQVDETPIASVAAGDTAEITMDLLPNVTLTGKVTIISAIGTTVNGLVKYTVTIALDPTDEPVRFGATANVTINTSEPHTVLAVPVNAVQTDTKGEYVTLVKATGATERIAVESGDLSNGLVTITASGLKEGDQVVLGAASTTSSSSSSSTKSNSSAGGPPDGGMMPIGGPN